MKKLILLSLICILFGCSEESNKPNPVNHVKYEVITSTGKWFGEYIVKSGQKICTCDETEQLKPTGWTYLFDVTTTPFTLHIDATTETNFGNPGTPDVTVNIYVNEILVETNTNNWAPGVTSADFVIL